METGTTRSTRDNDVRKTVQVIFRQALTSIAASTPARWSVRYWDENLLQGPPPCEPLPRVVGISVHLTFARRAFELADWYRAQGSKVILGGLHVLSCPDGCAPHGDALT